jgi:transcriptional regulator with XRE-family HTH domain
MECRDPDRRIAMKRPSNTSADLMGQLRQAMLPLGIVLDERPAEGRYQGDTFRDEGLEKIPFAECVRKQRVAVGLTQASAARLVPVSCITLKRWEAGKTVPVAAVQREVMRVLGGDAARTSCPGKRKLAALATSHHLHFEKHKGWIFRPTVDRGPKVVGKRLKFRLGTRDLEKAKERREVVLGTLRGLGLKVKNSRCGPKRRETASKIVPGDR